MADRPPCKGLKGEDDGNMEMGEEAPKSLPTTRIQAANSTQRRSARIAQRVAAYEANMSSKPSQSMGINLEVLPFSEFADGTTSIVSDLSMSAEELEEDDLLDDEEEYQREMEDQRIMDLKNGHFDEAHHLSIIPTATKEEIAPFMGRGQLYVNPERDGVGSVSHGEGSSVSAVFGQPCLEHCLKDETCSHTCMGSGNSSSFGSTQNQKHIPCFKEKEQRLISSYRHVDGENFVSPAAVEDRSLDLTPTDFAEETLQLDLMEARSLVCHHSKTGLELGPARGPTIPPITPAIVQVTPLMDHSLIPSPPHIIS